MEHMNQKIEDLLNQLRNAIHDAVAESWEVVQAMGKLEKEGRCPAFSVDVMLVDGPSSPLGEGETLVLTAEDEQFLRSLKIASLA